MSRFGRELSRLRRTRGLTLDDVGKAIARSSTHLYNIERGNKTCGGPLASSLADFFDLDGADRERFLALRDDIPSHDDEPAPRPKRLPLIQVTCKSECDHDGRLAPGGSTEGHERAGDCAHYAVCLGVFVKTYKAATKCHCPPDCSYRRQEEPKLQAASGWGSITFPSHGEGKGRSAR